MTLFVMADLEMLVCDKTLFNTYDERFYQRFLTITDTYETWVHEQNAGWLFSNELIDQLWLAYPWGAQIHEQTDLLTIFSTWLERTNKYIVISPGLNTLSLEPDIYANYANRDYPDLVFEWLNTLARNTAIDLSQALIFSFVGKPDYVTLIDSSSNTSQAFPLVRNEGDWRAALAQGNLWLRHQLPRTGDHPYIPAAPYKSGDADFPREFYPHRKTVGFKDNQGRLWIPDTERGQRHWDVQCPPYDRDNYFKVTPDGRLLGNKPPC